ncbi:MAG TPA: malto-oligosyltrehalose trehalohydrolase [Terracidiphilus sp.]|jgi:maltooligosyltrehalose trehalohydrolase
MHRFEVWAPRAKSMSVMVGTDKSPLHGPDDGWWRVQVDSAGPGSDYGFQIDNDQTVYPDPRSRWQPNGVHERSRIYDQAAFRWTDQHFQALPLASAVIYELHVGTFTPAGTLDSAIEKLDYLRELGISHVELMPIAAFAGEYGWGYDGVSLLAVHEPYGGPDALKRFVDAAHNRGLAVLLDVVYNHFGPVGNYASKFGPYLTEAHKTPWGGAVNLEERGSHQVRRFFCDNALMWMRDFHVDGLRIDAVHAFVDRSAIHFLEQLAIETETLGSTLGRRLVLIAESDLNDPRIVTSRECGGFGIDAQWSDDFHHALVTVLGNEKPSGYYLDFGSFAQLAKALEKTFVYDGIFSRHRNRIHGRPAGGLSQHRFIGFIQNHDQVGNRAFGDRISDFAGVDRAKIAAAVVLLGPSVPLVFQGEEWAATSPFQYFANHEDPELARQVSEGRKREFAAFGWDPSGIPDPENPETFLRSKLKWDELSGPKHAEMLTWYHQLIALRRSTSSLNNGEPGNTIVTFSQERRWLSMKRGSILVASNISAGIQSLPIPANAEMLLASKAGVRFESSSVTLPPDSAAVLRT